MNGVEAPDDQPFSAADEPGLPPGRRVRTDLRRVGTAALALAALGVVFGDIGTSPLYSLQTVFSADHHAVKPVEGDVYGIISLVFWAITLIVSVEFVGLIMRADNDGEGGIMALIALVQSAGLRGPRLKWVLISLGLGGVALFYGDGMITPAISVLSAVEGLEVVEPSLDSLVVPVTLGLLIGLFAVQRFGTQAIGRVFGPVMCVWFAVLAAAGLGRIAADPSVVRALSPTYAVDFFSAHPGIAFISLGSVILTITGAEALYADLGHFGRRPISRAWFAVVFPALTLNYMGQGSLIVHSPSSISSPFFLLLPGWSRIPMVVLATMATIIASQAVISGAFSVTRQAVRLGFLPRIAIRHTSASEIGQVYSPLVNWSLMAAVIALVIGFGSSTALASAYGVAVTGTLTVDTVLFFVVVRALWRKPTWLAACGAIFFGAIDLAFLAANANKIGHGGWFPVGIAALVYAVLSTWRRGSERLHEARVEQEGPLSEFVERLRAIDPPPARPRATGVYLNARPKTAPLSLHAAVERERSMPRTVVILSINTTKTPTVPDAERISVDDVGFEDLGIVHATARLGFQDTPDVPGLLAMIDADALGLEIDVDRATYHLSRVRVEVGGRGVMRLWRRRLFALLARHAASPIGYFRLPPDRTTTAVSTVQI